MMRNGRVLLSLARNTACISQLQHRFYVSGNNPDDLDKIISEFNVDEFLSNADKFIKDDENIVWDVPSEIAKMGLFSKIAIFSPLLVHLQQFTGLPYWSTIALFSAMLRISMIPLYLISTKEEMKSQQYSKELEMIRKQKMFVKSKEEKRHLDLLYQKQLQEFGIKTWKRFLVILPISTFIPMFATMKYMAKVIPLFQTGGMLWFSNLSVPDPYFILPMLNSALLFFNLRLNEKLLMPQPMPKLMKWLLGGSIIVSTIITMRFDACFFMFWIPLQLVQTFQTVGFYFYKKSWLKKFKKKNASKVRKDEGKKFKIYDGFKDGLVDEEDDL